MNAKPKDAIEELRHMCRHDSVDSGGRAILAYLDSLPDTCVCVEWPAELTRERLEEAAEALAVSDWRDLSNALRALAAIAPVRKKRVVNLWRNGMNQLQEWPVEWEPSPPVYIPEKWRCVARNVELED